MTLKQKPGDEGASASDTGWRMNKGSRGSTSITWTPCLECGQWVDAEVCVVKEEGAGSSSALQTVVRSWLLF